MRKLHDEARPPASAFRASLTPPLRGRVPSAYTGLTDPGAIADWCKARDPRRVADTIRRAERIVEGQVPLLGLGWLDVGCPPDWSRDPVSGHRAPLVPWSRIDFLDAASVGDHKAVWELNRHQYLLIVAQAYNLTGDGRYRSHVWEHVADWIGSNPLGQGVNWSSSLEVSFRAVAWSWLWHLADGRRAMDESLAAGFLRALEWHGIHVERYLSTWFSPNTHLTGEALGLCVLASFWPEAKRADTWWRTGAGVLEAELDRQVAEDGFHLERSACYHRYTVDFFLHYILLLRARGDAVAPRLLERVGAMVDAMSTLRRPDGRLVAVGDEDGGRFLPLAEGGPLDPGPTVLLAAEVLGGNGFMARESTAAQWELAWIVGPPRDPPDGEAGDPRPSVQVLPQAGFATLRAGGDFAFVSAGIQRKTRDCTGHVHDDAMSVELWLGGAPAVVDPGTFSYTGELDRRAWYRGAAAHSAVLPAHHAGPPRDQPFHWLELRSARLGSHGVGADHAYLSLRCPLGGGLVHDRLLVWRQGRGWLIWDRVRGASKATLTARFQWTPGCPVGEGRNGAVSLGSVRTLLLGSLVDGDRGRLVPSEVSPTYGRSVSATAWEAEGTHALPADGVTLVRPSSSRSTAVRTRVLVRDDAIHRAVWIGGREGERIGLTETVGTDIADFQAPRAVRLRWLVPGGRPLDISLDPLR